ncbi:rCG21680 [Rattus norvegicus]|uniref:RCG21680 n=1 Tax=Rattus norvegicus TaxID=10116 RepID=A6J1L1_RAT|nr:rCG21680 [Rattus norvegicus]
MRDNTSHLLASTVLMPAALQYLALGGVCLFLMEMHFIDSLCPEPTHSVNAFLDAHSIHFWCHRMRHIRQGAVFLQHAG